jgi:NAD(P)-dependent dehydrogenase (short-subunit alcohol dehydrogenase family)
MANLFDLGGRVVVITGGNGGIGLGMAEALVRAGASVSIWGRSAEKNEAAKAQLAATGAKVRNAASRCRRSRHGAERICRNTADVRPC